MRPGSGPRIRRRIIDGTGRRNVEDAQRRYEAEAGEGLRNTLESVVSMFLAFSADSPAVYGLGRMMLTLCVTCLPIL